jgi:hypothetical protein
VTPDDLRCDAEGSTGPEWAASQEHFNDMSRMLGVPTPNEADETPTSRLILGGTADPATKL